MVGFIYLYVNFCSVSFAAPEVSITDGKFDKIITHSLCFLIKFIYSDTSIYLKNGAY